MNESNRMFKLLKDWLFCVGVGLMFIFCMIVMIGLLGRGIETINQIINWRTR